AKKTLYLHTPYLVPNNSLADALKVAAMSGVDIRIIMPDKPDHMFVYWNNISAANDLMKNGIKVYMYHRGFVHSKTIVVDEKYCSIGSANLDDRSMVLNFETNAMIYSERIGKEMNDAFMEDLTYCTEYSCEEYNKRTTWMKFKIGISKLFKGLA
ncbi:MAG: phospholipase D-like domain-containing protein, partial [Candidatus Methanomethylophilaceae archaeon]